MLTNGIEPFILAVERNYTGDTKLIFSKVSTRLQTRFVLLSYEIMYTLINIYKKTI